MNVEQTWLNSVNKLIKRSSPTFLSQRSQLCSHFLKSIFELRAASTLFVQSCLHVTVLQRHWLDRRHRGNLALTLPLSLGLSSHGSQQVLPTTPK